MRRRSHVSKTLQRRQVDWTSLPFVKSTYVIQVWKRFYSGSAQCNSNFWQSRIITICNDYTRYLVASRFAVSFLSTDRQHAQSK